MTALSRHATAGRPRALFDPKELAPSERDWLRRLHMWRHYRSRGGWRAIGEPKLCTLPMARKLFLRGLVRYEIFNGKSYIEVTGLGGQLLAIMEQRQARRQG